MCLLPAWTNRQSFKKSESVGLSILYFIEYNAHTSIVRTWISQWFLSKKNNFTRIHNWKLIHHKSNLKPFLRYLPCRVRSEYFSIIFHVKKCPLYSIKYRKCSCLRSWKFLFNTSHLACPHIWVKYLALFLNLTLKRWLFLTFGIKRRERTA